ncbi:MAG: flagellar biosynthesis protein FlhF [Oscillospiraceae bacterium]|jgi:flagellar biosynthesis protein FlhF|nr:flagellar biosynthesis protein FlhF [Oscillospiraceae bacterium]
MTVKNYRAEDRKQILDTVKRELGSEAVILDVRKVRRRGLRNLFKKPLVEVSVAYEPDKIPSAAQSRADFGKITVPKRVLAAYRGAGTEIETDMPPAVAVLEAVAGTVGTFPAAKASGTSEAAAEPASESLAKRLDEIDKRMESLDRALSAFMNKLAYVNRETQYDYSPEVQSAVHRLVESQVQEELAHTIAKEAESILKKTPDEDALSVVKHVVTEMLGDTEPLRHKKFSRKTILVMGPTGVGKTTSIVKLAAEFSIEQKKKVGLINADTYRVGAHEQLQTYAEILEIPISIVYNDDELREAKEKLSGCDLVFIDTAGKRPGDGQHREEIERIIGITQPDDILLCVSAATGFAAAKEIIDSYGFAEKYKLLITKLDETNAWGMILNTVHYSGRPLTYVTLGQNVPDDIAQADAPEIADRLLGIDGQLTIVDG